MFPMAYIPGRMSAQVIDVHIGMVDMAILEIFREAKRRMYDASGPLPIVDGERATYICGVKEVEEDKPGVELVNFPEQVLMGKPVCVLEELAMPVRVGMRRIEAPGLSKSPFYL